MVMIEMIRIFLTILFFFMPLAEGHANSQLIRLSQIESGGSVQLLAFFDQLPAYDEQLNGKRLDLIAFDTDISASLTVPSPDADIVKTVVSHDQQKTIISFFFRYQPQHLRVSPGHAETLIVELTPGNRFTSTYRELASQLGTLEAMDRNRSTLINPQIFSAYSSDWESFFETYHGHSSIELSPRFYVPPFPLTALLELQPANHEQFLLFLTELNISSWFSALAQVQQKLKSNTEPDQSRYLALTHADVLYRLGNMDAAHEQFELLKQAYGEDRVAILASYAQALIDAQRGDIYRAHLILQSLSQRTNSGTALAEHIKLSFLESSLATGDYLIAEPLADHAESLPEDENIRWNLRLADLSYAAGRGQQSLEIYEAQFGTAEMDVQPYSLNAYCTLLHQKERFPESSRCYRRLAPLLEAGADRAAALYLETLAAWQSTKSADLLSQLESIVQQFPGSEAAARASITRADLCLARQQECSADARGIYRLHAQTAISRQIAQEASFKVALLSYLSGDESEAVRLLQRIRRNFLSGPLQNETLALLIEVLPKSILSLIGNGRDIEAISLAQQNRELFRNGWIDASILYELGQAFERLTLHDEALAVFLYLINLETFSGDEELLYSLVRVAHARANVGLVDDFAEQYLNRYPSGRHRFDVLYYLIDANFSDGQIGLAARLLPERLPERTDFKLLAAAISYYQDRQARTADILLPLHEQEELPRPYQFMLAEGLFESGKIDMSAAIYRTLAETEDYRDVSLYRLATIAGQNGNQQQSRELLEILREETGSRQWLQFVEQELHFKKLLSQR